MISTTNLSYMGQEALKLFRFGFTPIPVNGKSPILKNWTAFEPTEQDIIDCWIRHPNANIGVITGRNVIVVDADSPEAVIWVEQHLPATPVKVITARGMHFYYSIAPGVHIPNMVNRTLHIDVRGVGGQVVVPPSIHPDTKKSYAWHEEIGITSIDQIPLITADILTPLGCTERKTTISATVTFPDPIHNDLHSTFYSRILPQLRKPQLNGNYVKACCPAHDDKNPSFNVTLKDDHILFNCFAGCSFDAMIASLGLKPSDCFAHSDTLQMPLAHIELPDPGPVTAEPIQEPIQDTAHEPFPEHLLHPPGMVGLLADYITATSFKPQPIISLAASLCAMGTLLGHKIRTSTNLRTNLYILALAKTGAGKDHPRNVCKNLFSELAAIHLLGGESIASDAGLVDAVTENPVILFLLDEFGKMVKAFMGSSHAPHLANILAEMLKMFSSSGTTYMGKEYSRRNQAARKNIDQPCVSVLATATPSQLWDALTSAEIADGFLNRFLVFSSPDDPRKQKTKLQDFPQDLLDRCKEMIAMPINPNPQGNVDHLNVKPKVLPFSEEAERLLEAFEEEAHNEKQMPDLITQDLWARTPEHAQKLALVVAGANMQDVIFAPAMQFGIDLARYLTRETILNAREKMVVNEYEAQFKQVYLLIRAERKAGISKKELIWKTQFLNASTRNEILTSLVDSGRVVVRMERVGGSRKVSPVYRA